MNSAWAKYGCTKCNNYKLQVFVVDPSDSKSSFVSSYVNGHGVKCPAVAKGEGAEQLCSAIGHDVSSAGPRYLIKPDKSIKGYPSATEINNAGGNVQHVCGTSLSVALTSPNGGETWNAGSSHSITWTSAGAIAKVKIAFSSNNGSSWTVVADSAPNSGAFAWIVPSVSSAQCKVKISSAPSGTPVDESNNVFTIKPVVSIAYPNGGEAGICGITVRSLSAGRLDITVPKAGNYLISVYTADGRRIAGARTWLEAGGNSFNVGKTAGLARVTVISIKGEYGAVTHKVVWQD